MAVLNLFHIFATTVDSTAVEKNLLIMKFYNREKEIAELKRVQELAFVKKRVDIAPEYWSFIWKRGILVFVFSGVHEFSKSLW